MGEYLSTPNRDKHTEENENGRVRHLAFKQYLHSDYN